MRKKTLLIILLASAMPFVAMIAILFFVAPLQKEGLAQQRLTNAFSGVSGYFDQAGVELLAQARALAAGEAISSSLLQADQTGFFDQTAMIETIVKQMTLVNIDYLMVTDPQGTVLAQGHDPTLLGFSAVGDSLISQAMRGQEVHTLGTRDIKGRAEALVLAATPVWFRNRVVGTVEAGIVISEDQLGTLKGLSSAELVLMCEGMTRGSTIQGSIDQDILFMPNDVIQSTRLNGRSFRFASFPLSDISGTKVAEMLIGIGVSDIETIINNLTRAYVMFAVFGIALAIVLIWGFVGKALKQIELLSEGFSLVFGGGLEVSVTSVEKDELGNLAAEFNSMAASLKDRQQGIVDHERMGFLAQMALRMVPRLTIPLESISKSLTHLRSRSDSSIEPIYHNIVSETNLLTRLASEFSELSGFSSVNMGRMDLGDLARELLSEYDKEIQSGAMAVHLATTNILITADKNLLKRVFDIVLENAFEASGQGGRVDVRISIVRGFAISEITDSGPGFSDLARKNLFAPFFTTKADGNGLSLIMARKIMMEHDGTIEIEDNIGGGALVRLTLKLAGLKV
jgi:signal transduction histidine kinase